MWFVDAGAISGCLALPEDLRLTMVVVERNERDVAIEYGYWASQLALSAVHAGK
jgi:hypothetical protein